MSLFLKNNKLSKKEFLVGVAISSCQSKGYFATPMGATEEMSRIEEDLRSSGSSLHSAVAEPGSFEDEKKEELAISPEGPSSSVFEDGVVMSDDSVPEKGTVVMSDGVLIEEGAVVVSDGTVVEGETAGFDDYSIELYPSLFVSSL